MIEASYRLDLLVEDTVVVEVKSVERLLLVHDYREQANYLERTYDFVERIGLEKVRKETVYAAEEVPVDPRPPDVDSRRRRAHHPRHADLLLRCLGNSPHMLRTSPHRRAGGRTISRMPVRASEYLW